MAENEIATKEAEPKYRKSAQWFAVGVVLLLALVLIIDTFRRSGQEPKEPEPLAVERRQNGRQNELDFEARLDQEIKRRQLQKLDNIKREKDQTTQRPPAVGVQNSSQSVAAKDPIEPKEPNIYNEWKTKEKRRALEARQAGFLLNHPDGKRTRTTSSQPIPGTTRQGNKLALNDEQKRVIAEIKRLEAMQKGRGPAPEDSPAATTPIGFNQMAEDPATVGRPQSEATPKPGQKLMTTGTIIGAVLDQRLMSDYTGPFRGLVTHDVYDVSDKYILIPKGSRVIGRSLRITNVNEPIQARMGLVVKWLVLPNGKRISFEKRVAALDRTGVPAIKDQVNYHLFAQFMGVAAYALLASSTSYKGSSWADDKTFEGNLGQSLREQFAPLAGKYLSLVPTITLREGTPLKIFIEDDIYAYPWESISNRLFRVNRPVY